jgi:hypothetical protein
MKYSFTVIQISKIALFCEKNPQTHLKTGLRSGFEHQIEGGLGGSAEAGESAFSHDFAHLLLINRHCGLPLSPERDPGTRVYSQA